MNYKIGKIWKLNGNLVIADTIEEAIEVYSLYLKDKELSSIEINEDSALICVE